MPHALPGLDLLRAVAIVWVMLFHSWIVGGLGPDWSWLSRHGWMGVDLFFVLSGYLIGGQVLAALGRDGRLSLTGFYRRRAWRILPAYLATLALYLAWPDFREAPGMEPAWKFLSFTVNLSIDYNARQAFSHAWSLCVEEHFYALFPLIALALWRWGSARSALALGLGLLLGGIALRAALFQHGQATDPEMTRNWFLEDLYYPSWCRLDGLLCGVVLAAVQQCRPHWWQRARRWADAAALGGLATLGVAFWVLQERVSLAGVSVGWPLLSVALAALVFAGAGRDSLIGRWQVPGAGALAAISYSLYLVHKPAYHLVQLHGGDALQGRGLLAFAAYGAAALAAGAAMYLLVERPGLRWRDRLR
ncbi:acyltransferase [Ideonella sp. 4Y16]|uniref:acyltransferase family protein n=1 Tax=Ideonella alba TaxID=2824118 RepID=UPI001B372408|nr:acyltransferase [Ideonella alba]MBQ0944721.1 acyltransferase [Ideonella alba]